MMNKAIAMIGIGEMGGVFARGFLKLGHSVYPVLRDVDWSNIEKTLPETDAVVLAVGEKDLAAVLRVIPQSWHNQLILLQNELLPNDWKSQQIHNPTVISVWFEKKHPQDYKVIIPSPVYGPKAELVQEALGTLGIACTVLKNEEELLFELILKNLYILTVNIAGLEVGGTVGDLWQQHQPLARDVANDILDIQFGLAGKDLERENLIQGMVKAFEGDLAHKCMGRSAPARLERAIAQADRAGLEVKKLREISLRKD